MGASISFGCVPMPWPGIGVRRLPSRAVEELDACLLLTKSE
jgi:hypothetical protein